MATGEGKGLVGEVEREIAESNESVPFGDFNPWFEAILEEVRPNLVVAIARGAVRLLQVQRADALLSGVPALSNHALPFLPDSAVKGKRALLFDDSTIFGSTMADVREYLMKRGATVFCASYVVDRSNFLGEEENGPAAVISPSHYSEMPIRRRHDYWPDAIRRHHDVLARSLCQIPSHYNLDFPTFCLDMSEFAQGDIPLLVALLRNSDVFRAVCDVSSSASLENAIFRYTGFFAEGSWALFATPGLRVRQCSKARIAFLPRIGKIEITPLMQLAMDANVTHEQVRFVNSTVESLWKKLVPPFHQEPPYYGAALFRLLTSFAAMLAGEGAVRKCVAALQGDFPVTGVHLVQPDIEAVLGPDNRRGFTEVFALLQEIEDMTPQDEADASEDDDAEEPTDERLTRAIAEAWRLQPELRPQSDDLTHEMLGKIFLTLWKVTDSPECRKENPAMSRLEVGLSYTAVRDLLKAECGITLSPDEISLAMDMCVDNGQSVPKVILHDSIWVRAFYSGERKDSVEAMQFMRASHLAYGNFLNERGTSPLSPFDFQKLCVTLKDLLPWLPISSRFSTFGKCCQVGQEDLIDWFTRPGSALRVDSVSGKNLLQINGRYIPPVKTTWNSERQRSFQDYFDYIARAFTSLGTEAKLLLSTCRTHRHSYNAVAYEAHSWTSHISYNFPNVLSEIEKHEDGAPLVSGEGISSLYWSILYVSEALKKHEVFHERFQEISARIRATFDAQGPAARRFFEYCVAQRVFLNPSRESEVEYHFGNLMPIVRQMQHLTAFTARFLLDAGALRIRDLEGIFYHHNIQLGHSEFHWLLEGDSRSAAGRYNGPIGRKEVPGDSFFKTNLPEDLPADTPSVLRLRFPEVISAARECGQEIAQSLEVFCPEYCVQEGDFQYLPDHNKHVLSDGTVVRRFQNMFLLTTDLRASTDAEESSAAEDRIAEILGQFHRPDLYHEFTRNDGLVICCEDPKLIWDVAMSLGVEDVRIRNSGGKLRGIRLGISYGSVSVLRSPEGAIAVRSASIPHIVPKAFGLLEGFDTIEAILPTPRGPFVLVEMRDAANQCAGPLGLVLNHDKARPVHGKHFSGFCYVVELTPSRSLL